MDRIGTSETDLKLNSPKKQKKEYVKPKVTTFGSVAKLTLGGGGSCADLLGTRAHDHHHHHHHHGY